MPQENQDQAEAPPLAAKFVNEEGRSRLVPLEYPVDFNGRLYSEIKVHRVTGGEMDAYMKSLQAGAVSLPPVIDCPIEVWDAMDADDQLAVDRAADAFMPRRLKALMKSAPAAGEEG